MKKTILSLSLGAALVGCKTSPTPPVIKPNPPQPAVETFNTSKTSSFKNFKTIFGTVVAENGSGAFYNKSASGGNGSLRITGGVNKQVTLKLNPEYASKKLYAISFQAERWTGRNPFAFKVEAKTAGKWMQVGTKNDIKVGSFNNKVHFPLGGHQFSEFRFTATTAQGGGVLIDNLSLDPRALIVQAKQAQTPVLIGNDNSLLLQFSVTANTKIDDQLNSLVLSTYGTTDLNDIESLSLFATKADNNYRSYWKMKPIATVTEIGEQVTFALNQKIDKGVNNFWVACKLKPSADLLHKVDAGILNLSFAKAGDQEIIDAHPAPIKRIGQNLMHGGMKVKRTNGTTSVCKAARIPGMVTTNKGTLLAVYDLRWDNYSDLPGDLDVGLSRSTDGGQTWEAPRPIMDMGTWGRKNERNNGCGDPAILVDRTTNEIYVVALWAHGVSGGWYWGMSKPGMKPGVTGQVVIVKSSDDGKTWSKPLNITPQIKDPKWSLMLNGPGAGICLKDGTLVFASQFQEPSNKRRARSSIFYSKDKGKTWTMGTGIPYHQETTEAQVVELANGDIMINARISAGGRAVYTTSDLGKTWKEHHTSGNKVLPMVRGCQASILRYDQDRLIYSAPDDFGKRRRSHMSIRVSNDEGETWLPSTIFDEIKGAYSCLSIIDGKYIGLLYEGSQSDNTFEKIAIDELILKKK